MSLDDTCPERINVSQINLVQAYTDGSTGGTIYIRRVGMHLVLYDVCTVEHKIGTSTITPKSNLEHYKKYLYNYLEITIILISGTKANGIVTFLSAKLL